MDGFTVKDELGGNKLVLRPAAQPGEHIEPWCVNTAEDGTVTIRGAAVDKLAEHEDLQEKERRTLWQRKEIAGARRMRMQSMKKRSKCVK